jgi:hypothetical protein
MNAKLRQAPSGPEIGNPPVLLTPNLVSLVATDEGDDQTLEFDIATPTISLKPTYLLSGGQWVDAVLLPGYRYVLHVAIALQNQYATIGSAFICKWNRRIKSTGLWEFTDNGSPYLATRMTSAESSAGGRVITNQFVLQEPFVPAIEYDRIVPIIQDPTGLGQAGQFLINGLCWVSVWERGGLVP